MDIKSVVNKLRESFEAGRTRSLDFREAQLRALLRMYEENQEAMAKVLHSDLRKSKQEAYLTEINVLINDAKDMIQNFRDYVKPEKPKRDLTTLLDEQQIIKEPYGVALIIGAWNYPLQLALLPLAGAIAAGNCVIIKPSEVSPASAKFIEDYIPKYLDQSCYQVVCGGPKETTELLNERFDYIFYTGSTMVGKIVHAAAAKNLTPVTLELGGKSPVYIDSTVDLEMAAKRILWGKFLNLGQTCIAPDYLLCDKSVQDEFLKHAKNIIRTWYGDDPKQSPDLGRIVSDNHFKRVSALIKDCNIVIGGKSDSSERYIEPTIVIDVKPEDAIMKDEIFGPVLPIITISNAREAINFISKREKPLVFYIFSQDRPTIDVLLENVSSGGSCVNDTVMHAAADSLPFGGVGASGCGRYHGRATFDTFVHQKSILIKSCSSFGEKLGANRYPPYSQKKIDFLQNAISKRNMFSCKNMPNIMIFTFGVCCALLGKYLCDIYCKRDH